MPPSHLLPTLTAGALVATVAATATADPPEPERRQLGNAASVEAVSEGLDWLAKRQNADGSWDFDRGYADAGTWRSKCGATAVALLPFCSMRYTHKSKYGDHAHVVQKGLDFLIGQMHPTSDGAAVFGKNEDATWHALASLALCEFYAETRDRSLAAPAQKAVNHIVATQDPKTGGWARKPGQPPDTVTTAWHVRALVSANTTWTIFPRDTAKRAVAFFDQMGTGLGVKYRRTPGQRPDAASTAAGLFCRVHTGWKRENPVLRTGAAKLARRGVWKRDVVYSYFCATLLWYEVCKQTGPWRQAIIDRLMAARTASGDEAGSWFDRKDAHAAEGGRLLQTALNLVLLDVYHRRPYIMSTEEEFKVD